MNKQEAKICQECQQGINENKYYSVILDKNIILCSNCWELKKDDYKEKLKEKWQKELFRLYQSSGQKKDVDKNSGEVIERIHAWKTEGDSQNHLSTEFGICFGCDEWNETGKEHGEVCQNKIAEKKELEISQASNHLDPDSSNQIKSNQIKSNQIKSNQIKSNQIKSNQIKSNQIKSNQIKSNQIKSNQINSRILQAQILIKPITYLGF